MATVVNIPPETVMTCVPTHEYAFQKLLPRTHNGAVVLLHSTSKTNAEILDELLTKWKETGYTFASVEDLFV